MIRKIYHGSDHIIRRPVLAAAKICNDYGPGFYCTEDAALANEWSVSTGRDGFACSYEFDAEGLATLDLTGPGCTALHWLAVLVRNRTFNAPGALARDAKEYLVEYFLPPCESADVITGYRADDSRFSLAQDFLNGTISYRHLKDALDLDGGGLQIVLKSSKAFARLRFREAQTVPCSPWEGRKRERDAALRHAYLDTERFALRRNDLYIHDVLDKEMRPDDARLR